MESHRDGSWQIFSDVDQVGLLKDCLETRGIREGALHTSLVRCEDLFKASSKSLGGAIAMPSSAGKKYFKPTFMYI